MEETLILLPIIPVLTRVSALLQCVSLCRILTHKVNLTLHECRHKSDVTTSDELGMRTSWYNWYM